jgi:hypothetical protein
MKVKTIDMEDLLNIMPEDDNSKSLPTTYRPSLDNDNDEVNTDAKYVRQNLYDLLEKGHGAIDELLAVADQSQHPRAYEVLATMIKTMAETNRDLLELHQKKKQLIEKEKSTETVNNNLFVGSTKDLLELLNKK